MQIAHKIEIKPNNKQKTYLNKCFGVSRFAYNWALAEWQKKYSAGQKTNALSLKKEFNSIKKDQYPWTKEVTKWACQQPFINLQKAFDRFFKKKSAYPKFKKKGKRDSFYTSCESIKVEVNYLKLPLLKSKIKMTESLRFTDEINSVVFSKRADRYFASFQMEIENPKPVNIPNRSVGVDIGVKSLFVTSDGHEILSVKPLKTKLRKIKRYSRQLNKKVKGSKNARKMKTKLSRLHLRVFNQRSDVLHKFTTFLCKNYKIISIENLTTSNMIKNHKLAQAISDIGIGEFKRQLEYKSKLYANTINLVDRFYPSSKLCSQCGSKKEDLRLSDRVYICSICNLVINRDYNASLNINKTVGEALTEFTPVEITALQRAIFPFSVTSIGEAGI